MIPVGAFVADDLHPRDITLPDGTVHTFHFRELPALEFRRFQIAESSDDEDKRAASINRLIVASLVNPDGSAALTVPQAAKLKGSVATALLEAILDVNGFTKKKGADEALG